MVVFRGCGGRAHCFSHEDIRRLPLPLRVVVWEKLAYVRLAQGTEDGICGPTKKCLSHRTRYGFYSHDPPREQNVETDRQTDGHTRDTETKR
jgi:hypothetical protein